MLYRKYRPQTFADVTGQEHVVQTLQGALLSDSIGHAYLFTGPRGTGKTSMARLLAKALNCENRKPKSYEPCNSCDSCTAINTGASLDLIEIDAASNRGIDEIRSVKESTHVSSSGGAYKIFIIDEVHMLTTSAFNALLKTLEEPPEHVVFVLATTEAHRVLDTIVSRVQRFDFKKLTHDQITGRLGTIAQQEKLKIDDQALAALADSATGSMRDAQSALTKVIAYAGDTITQDHIAEILGIVPHQTHEALLQAVVNNNTQDAIGQIQTLAQQGVAIEHFTKQFIRYLRHQLITVVNNERQDITPQQLVTIINACVQAQQSFDSAPIVTLPLELAVVELTSAS